MNQRPTEFRTSRCLARAGSISLRVSAPAMLLCFAFGCSSADDAGTEADDASSTGETQTAINTNPLPIFCGRGVPVLPDGTITTVTPGTAVVTLDCPPQTTDAPNLASTAFEDHYEQLFLPFMSAVDQCYAQAGTTLYAHLKGRFPSAFANEAVYLKDGDDIRVTETLFEYLLEARRDVFDAWQADPGCPGASLEQYVATNAPGLLQLIRADNSDIATRRALSDFDGDGLADYAVFTPSTGYWTVRQSSSATSYAYNLGGAGERVTPGDFDGDGRTDVAVWNVSNGEWSWTSSATGGFQRRTFGVEGDLPAANDFDGDGRADYVVFRPSNGTWYVMTAAGAYSEQQWGTAGDVPVTGDWDYDGKADFAVWRPSENRWWIIQSESGTTDTFVFGNSSEGDQAVPGDYDGDGRTDAAVVRIADGRWTIRESSTGTIRSEWWGTAGDLRIPNDYDGDGKTEVSVWRTSTGQWFQIRSSDGAWIGPPWGHAGDVPVSSAFLY